MLGEGEVLPTSPLQVTDPRSSHTRGKGLISIQTETVPKKTKGSSKRNLCETHKQEAELSHQLLE